MKQRLRPLRDTRPRAGSYLEVDLARSEGPIRRVALDEVEIWDRAKLVEEGHIDRVGRELGRAPDGARDLIERFGQATGVPVVLNTSFNLRGEPIVNTPREAFATFQKSGLDALVLGNYFVRKNT